MFRLSTLLDWAFLLFCILLITIMALNGITESNNSDDSQENVIIDEKEDNHNNPVKTTMAISSIAPVTNTSAMHFLDN